MNIKTTKKELFDLVQKTFPLVPLKSTLQVLSNFKISLTNSRLEIAATDLDHSIKAHMMVTGQGSFAIIVNARKVFDVIKELPEGEIYINVKENVFIIESEKGFSCKLAGAEPTDFPLFPDVTITTEFSISVNLLAQMITKSGFAVSRDESRACLCGILWELDTNKMNMVATDGHRLGNTSVPMVLDVPSKMSVIVSVKSLSHIVKIGDGGKDDASITVKISEKYIIFSKDTLQLCSKLIDGPYPDYRKAIPAENPRKAIIDRSVLHNAVRRVSVLSNQKTNLVKFTFKNGELELVVLNRDIGGEAREVIPVDYSKEEHSIGFNGQYLSEILSIINTPKISMEMNTQISATLLFPVYEDPAKKISEDLFLIMPLKIMEEA